MIQAWAQKRCPNPRDTAQTPHAGPELSLGVPGEVPAHSSPTWDVFCRSGWTSMGSTRSAWSTCRPSGATRARHCCPACPCPPSDPRLQTNPRGWPTDTGEPWFSSHLCHGSGFCWPAFVCLFAFLLRCTTLYVTMLCLCVVK